MKGNLWVSIYAVGLQSFELGYPKGFASTENAILVFVDYFNTHEGYVVNGVVR